jgi:hypothetical protein
VLGVSLSSVGGRADFDIGRLTDGHSFYDDGLADSIRVVPAT